MANAQQTTTLEGLWTLAGERIDGVNVPGVPNRSFKMIAKDKTFTNFSITHQRSFISVTGTVEILSDSVYIENVGKSMNSTLDGKAINCVIVLKEKMYCMSNFLSKRQSESRFKQMV